MSVLSEKGFKFNFFFFSKRSTLQPLLRRLDYKLGQSFWLPRMAGDMLLKKFYEFNNSAWV